MLAGSKLAILTLGVLATGSVGVAQTTWSQLLVESQVLPGADQLPGFQANELVRNNGFRDFTVIPNGNFAGLVSTDRFAPFGQEDWYLFGSVDRGTTVGALRREGTYDGQNQLELRSAVGVDLAGNLFYEAELAAPGAEQSLWLNDTLLLEEGDVVPAGPLMGSTLDSFTRTTLAPNGDAYWVSSYSGASGSGVAIFRDLVNYEVLLQGGDSIGGGLTAEPELFSGNLSWSAERTNYLTSIKVAATPVNNDPNFLIDEAVALNGQVVSVEGGGVLREGDTVPAEAGGLPGETWAPGSLMAVNEAGDWAASSSVRMNGVGNTTSDMIVYNGEIVYRDGDVVDGHTLSGLPQDLSINDRGDLAFVWDNKAFLNGEIVAEVGDLVDTDDDGVNDTAIINLFDLDLTNLPSGDGDGKPLAYMKARIAGSLEIVARNALVTLEGDYNGDGAVNAADYTVWRDTEGSTLLLGADGDLSNTVDAGDFTVWSDSYGGVAAAPAVGVPEPLSLGMASVACLALGAWRPYRV
ncbi:hypothetical protein MalM25_15980 [Planctomycetes bacterium MalM25]|nr:hypothetical protein MalM25_15980 [Planctomycetes bacterium MalM25]